MRPSAGLEATSSRPRKQSDPSDRPNLTPTTFFLTRDPNPRPTHKQTLNIEPDASPVRSLKETLEEVDRESQHTSPRHRQQEISSNGRRRSTIKPQTFEELVPDASSQMLHLSQQIPLGSVTPSVPTFQEPSLPSSPKSISSRSFARSDDELTQDETNSQAVTSSEGEQDEETPPEVHDSAPQLIMPSIRMPSRRPFTERGKQLGRFKILVAGTKGSGRTSLIKSMVQLCEDIVHVDSVTSTTKPSAPRRSNTDQIQPVINEIYASTKAYPFWWSDLDESRVLKRRKSVGDAVLERNICFVDTSNSGRPDRVIQYLEQQLITSINAVTQAEKEFTGLLSGRGGVQVDVVLYLLTKDNFKDDCHNIQRVSRLCNVIPLIAKADVLAPELISELKAVELQGISLPHLPFGNPMQQSHRASAPYCVSSANGSDFDNMDASLLMSPEYVRPLVASELSLLVQQLFEPHTVSYLRYTSAKKLASWYANDPRLTRISSPSLHSPQASTLNSPLPTSLSNSGVLVPLSSELSLNTSNSYALAKVVDHAQREEHLAQIRLSKWASDLQLSLQRERERYECLAQSERALWLVQRMGEEVRGGHVPSLQHSQTLIKVHEKSRNFRSEIAYEAHDPLGLLRWQDTVRTRGWAALQIVGSFGVVGGIALWLAKTWGFTTSLHEWAQDWMLQISGSDD